MMNTQKVFSISDVYQKLQQLIDVGELKGIQIQGEVTNFRPSDLHWRFVLKDENTTIEVVIFKNNLLTLGCKLEEGLQVICTGDIRVYQQQGKCQLSCTYIQESGVGYYKRQVAEIYYRLEQEGLFNPEHKKKVSRLPTRIGIASKGDSQGYLDIISIAKERYPLVKIIHAECNVQGESAADSIVTALQKLEVLQVDTIVLARGGGDKIEALMPFNDERVVRQISVMKTPVITGIGHESDTTIADSVADKRGATPTHAGMLAGAKKQTIVQFMYNLLRGIKQQGEQEILELKLRSEGAVTNTQRTLLEMLLRNYREIISMVLHKVQKQVYEERKRCKAVLIISLSNIVKERQNQLRALQNNIKNTIFKIAYIQQQTIKNYVHQIKTQTNYRCGNKLYEDIDKYKKYFSKHYDKMKCQIQTEIKSKNAYLKEFGRVLEACSVTSILARGFAILMDGNDHIITDIAALKQLSECRVVMTDGEEIFEIRTKNRSMNYGETI